MASNSSISSLNDDYSSRMKEVSIIEAQLIQATRNMNNSINKYQPSRPTVIVPGPRKEVSGFNSNKSVGNEAKVPEEEQEAIGTPAGIESEAT